METGAEVLVQNCATSQFWTTGLPNTNAISTRLLPMSAGNNRKSVHAGVPIVLVLAHCEVLGSQQVALRPRSDLKGLALFRCHHRVHET